MKKCWPVILGATVAGLLLAPMIVPFFAPWSGINCRHEDINLKTGQVRSSRSLWFITISEHVADTPLSAALQGEAVDVAGVEPWHRVNTFSPGVRHSPHYGFHSAAGQICLIDSAFRTHKIHAKERQAIAKEVLRLWQTSGSAGGADALVHELLEHGIWNQPAETTR